MGWSETRANLSWWQRAALYQVQVGVIGVGLSLLFGKSLWTWVIVAVVNFPFVAVLERRREAKWRAAGKDGG